MDREQLKAATAGRQPGKGGAKAATRVSDALGSETEITLGGRTFRLRPLTLRDLVIIEDRYDTLQVFFDALNEFRASAIQFFLWLMLRKSEPQLTEEEAGDLVPLRDPELTEVINQFVRAAGLTESDEKGGGPARPSTG